MVVFEGQTGSIGGHSGRCDWASDSGAQFTFDEFGAVTFGSSGYGENDRVTVQLAREYGRYFCSTSSCGGFKNWISALGTVTPHIVACRVTIIVFDSVQKTPVDGARVCLGLMCQNTPSNGEVYLGQFVFGTYTLVIAKTGYESLIEDITLSTADLRTSRSITPTGEPEPGKGCEGFPSFLRPICVFLSGLITAAIDTLTKNVIDPILRTLKDVRAEFRDVWSGLATLLDRIEKEATDIRDRLGDEIKGVLTKIDERATALYTEIETKHILPLVKAVDAIWEGISSLWEEIEAIIEAAQEEAKEWRKKVTELDKTLRAWVETSIVDILIKALDKEADKEVNK